MSAINPMPLTLWIVFGGKEKKQEFGFEEKKINIMALQYFFVFVVAV